MHRPASTPQCTGSCSASFLPSLALDSPTPPTTSPGALASPVYSLNGRSMSPLAIAAANATNSSQAFEQVQPFLDADAVTRADKELRSAEQSYNAILEERAKLREDSKTWWELNDSKFSNQLKGGSTQMKRLDFEELAAQKELGVKRALAVQMSEALTAQENANKKARLYEKRRQETAEAAMREQEALTALAKAKQQEGAAKRALRQVGQL
jgi:hypothetical protein